jgi:hypothetical protein
MPYYKFGKNDLFRNVITTFPEVSFDIYGEKVYYQNQDRTMVNPNNPTGYLNLYELNVNRAVSAATATLKLTLPDAAFWQNVTLTSTDGTTMTYYAGNQEEISAGIFERSGLSNMMPSLKRCITKGPWHKDKIAVSYDPFNPVPTTMYFTQLIGGSGGNTTLSTTINAAVASGFAGGGGPNSGLIYPFMPKDASLTAFKNLITTSSFASLDYGTKMTGSYPMTANMNTYIYTASADVDRKYVEALKNVLNNKTILSPHYAYSASYADFSWNKATQQVTLIDIPSIFYGSKIKKGTVNLGFFLSGSSLGQLVDKDRDGALYQVSGTISDNDGKVAGVVLYEEGIFLLTGSWALNDQHTAKYIDDSTDTNPSWNAYGRLTESTPSSSYSVNFSGSQTTSVLTMMCHAPGGELNFSKNPTYVDYNTVANTENPHSLFVTSSTQFYETTERKIKNTVSSSYECYNEGFESQTFLTKIGIYDANNNLIAIANLARPVKKTVARDLTFKLKLDI